MPRVYIDSDDWLAYSIGDSFGRGVDINDQTYKRWVRIMRQFRAMQDEMEAAYKNAQPVAPGQDLDSERNKS